MAPTVQHSKKALERFVFFSDAVFAFALTLLAVELKLPPHAGNLTSAELLEALAASERTFLCYVIGFLIIASLWTRHHRMFEKVENYDSPLVTLNFLVLFFVSLVPFSIELVTAAISSPVALAIYCGLLSVAGFSSYALFFRLHHTEGLHAEPLRGRPFLRESVRELSLPVTCLVLCALAILSPPQSSARLWAASGLLMMGLRFFTRRALRE